MVRIYTDSGHQSGCPGGKCVSGNKERSHQEGTDPEAGAVSSPPDWSKEVSDVNRRGYYANKMLRILAAIPTLGVKKALADSY